jgi:thiol:disulfide interchange protein DsbA
MFKLYGNAAELASGLLFYNTHYFYRSFPMRYLLALSTLLFSLAACADQSTEQAEFVEGKHYVVLDQPVRTNNPGKIEVAEIFSYHCGHCFSFEPALQAWKKQQPEDVVVVQTHAMWNEQMKQMAQAFYTTQALKIADKAHMGIFNAIHLERKQFNTPQQWAAFLANFGSDEATILKTFNSFGVTSQVSQADARARGYGITSTPEMVVNGKYRISSRLTGGQAEMLKVAEFLVAKERAALK